MTDAVRPEELTVPVPGGDLAVLRWPAASPDAPTALAVHGITANGLSWGRVARHLAGRLTLLAPDLRGRAGSRGVTGPYGLARHADDVAAVLAHLGVAGAVAAGHSMGAWVTALAAVRHPGRFGGLVLVDGAVTFPLPPGVGEEDALAAVLGPAMDRLSMTFPDRDTYRAFWQGHPAFAGLWCAEVDAYVQRDLVGTEPELGSSCVLDAVRADGGEVLLDREAAAAVHRLPCPATLLWAERGLMDEAQGLYDDTRLAAAALDASRVAVRGVPDTNHYSLVIGQAGAAVVAEELVAAAERVPAAG